MKTRLKELCCGSEAMHHAPLESKTKSAMAAMWPSSSTKGVVVVSLSLLVLVVFTSTRWIDGTAFPVMSSKSEQALSSDPQHPHKPQSKPITLTCGNQTKTPICHRLMSPSPSPASSILLTEPQTSASCPEYFRWMHEDLRPWKSTGITREMVSSAQKFATFRLVVLGGRVYVEHYRQAFQTRDVFTLWGILLLVNRYPGRVPDLDLMFNCNDTPLVKSADYRSQPPPPLFRYCKNDRTLDIVFPDWSFWGWAEIKIKPWGTLMEELKEGNRRVKWRDRKPYAYWKGNPWVSASRRDLMKCNVSRYNAHLYAQNWDSEMKQEFKNSNLASQCSHRYKIYIEGQAWSVSQKYILACDSPALVVTTHFHDFFSRGLIPGLHYWPIRESDKCRSINFAVDWGNKHQKEAETMGKAGSGFVQEELKMDYVYDYMLHSLMEYAKLLRYKPTIPEKATELCLESMACPATGVIKNILTESMVKSTDDAAPCKMPPPFDAEELQEILDKKANAIKQVELWEKES